MLEQEEWREGIVALRANFQRSPSQQPFGSMCLCGIFWPSLAQWDLGIDFNAQESKQ